jgi:methylmalonyl-CoA/ethylmalonyl-CoA epimerase
MRRIVATLALAASSVAPPQAQAPGALTFADNAIRHVGVIVRDVDQAAKDYADLFGLPVPRTREVPDVSFPADFTGDRAAHPKVALIQLANISIESLQPIGGASPWRNHLERFSEGLHHIAFGVPDVGKAVAHLERFGGTHVMGTAGYPEAYVDMKAILGFTFELNQNPPAPAAGSSRTVSIQPATAEPIHFGMAAISHAGVLVPDVERAAKVFGELMGIPAPKANADASMVFPKGFSGDPNAHPKTVSFRLRPISVEYAEPQGGKSLWREHLDAFGPFMPHLAVAVQGLEKNIAYLESKGGTLVLGPGLGYRSSTSSPSHSDSLSS